MKRLYVVYDTVAQEANPPFWANNDAQALRIHQTGIANIPAPQQAELQLLYVADIDEISGIVFSKETTIAVHVALDDQQMDEAANT